MDLLADRISQSINELALQIDSLYKLSEKDRQGFLNKIQLYKTNLIGLKSSLKLSNKELIQSQYKTIRAEIIEMKRFLDVKLEQIRFKNANQQNRSIQQNRLNSYNKMGVRNGSMPKNNDSLFDTSGVLNRSSQYAGKVGLMRHISKKQYQELMSNIVQKTQKSQQLLNALQIVKEENSSLKQINLQLEGKMRVYQPELQKNQRDLNDMYLKLSLLENELQGNQLQLNQIKENQIENRNKCNRYFIEITQLKNQLDITTSQLINQSNIEEINLYKITSLQETVSKYQKEIAITNQEHHQKQLQMNKKIQILEEYQLNYDQSLKKISKLQIQLQNQREDIEVLQSQLTKCQKQYYQLKIEKEIVETALEKQKQLSNITQTQKNKQFSILKSMLVDSEQLNQTNQLQINKLNQKISECQEMYLLQRQSRETLQQILTQIQSKFQKDKQSYVCDIELKKIQISKLSEQVRKSLQLTRTLQEEINQNHMKRTKIREDQRLLLKDYKDIEIKNIQLSKNYQQLQYIYQQTVSHLHAKENQLLSAEKSILSLGNQLKQTKNRLHKAKIQAIHDIRNTLF